MDELTSATYRQQRVEASILGSVDGNRQLLAALERYGFAIVGDGWSESSEVAALDAAVSLFMLPDAVKQEHRASHPRSPGFIEYGRTRAMDTGIPNLLQGWNLSSAPMGGDRAESRVEYAELRGAGKALQAIANRAIRSIEEAVDSADALVRLMDDSNEEYYALHYPRSILGVVKGARRQSLHVDSSIVTLLPRSTHEGLLVQCGESLLPVHPAPGDLVLQVGAILEYVTAGYLPACRHTVETPETQEAGYDRTSLVYFVSAAPSATLSPLGRFSDVSTVARFPTITVGEFERSHYGQVYTEE